MADGVQVKGKLYPVDVYSVAALRNLEGGAQAEPGSGRRGRKQRRAGTQGLAATSGPAALSGNRTRSADTISKIKFKQMVGRQREIEQVCCLWLLGHHWHKCTLCAAAVPCNRAFALSLHLVLGL